jgi:hypothetical protein
VRSPRALAAALFIVSFISIGQSSAFAGVDDTHGREWRQLYETTGLSWDQVASVCPRDGKTPCSGTVGGKDLTGWVWGTDEQVLELLIEYAPELETADPPLLSGSEYFLEAMGFLNVMRWTVSHSSNYSFSEWTGGWTASKNESGTPIGAGAGFAHPIFNGQIGLGPVGAEESPNRGVFLWRTAGLDYSPPVITPKVEGTIGRNGWYVSDVSVTWDVADAQSPIDSRTGCDPASVTTDRAGVTFTCRATSVGGTASASAAVKRDHTAPTVTCDSPAPTFSLGQLGAGVSATVTDATSGPAPSSVRGQANTATPGARTASVTGSDLAGNTATKQCPYDVVVPPCRGLSPTRVGTPGNDVINGTPGRDIIVAVGGNDTIKGSDGDDVICGGDGADTIDGDNGADAADGGAGPDSIFGSGGNDTLDGGAQNDSIRGDGGRDICTSGEERMSSCEVIR